MFKKNDSAAPSSAISAGWRHDRSVDELLGICRGVLADGAVSLSEAGFLLDWIERHSEFIGSFPFNALFERLSEALRDGVLDAEEERDLLEAIQATVGGEAKDSSGSNSLSTTLPFDHPAPTIQLSERTFVLTGTFSFGPRNLVRTSIEERHGKVVGSVSMQTSYVVVGEVGSRDWIHSSYGRKIQQAVELKQRGAMIAIIPEAHWKAALVSP